MKKRVPNLKNKFGTLFFVKNNEVIASVIV
jgi:hypothetical protein